MDLHIRQNHPATLQTALETALELESCELESKQRNSFVRIVHLEEYPVQQPEIIKSGETVNANVVQQLMEAWKQLSWESRGRTSHTFF